jgi:acetyl esterase/lipase
MGSMRLSILQHTFSTSSQALNLASIFPTASITPVKLILSGTSSGGHLAAIISQHAREWLAKEGNKSVAERVRLVGVLLRAPVTVDAGDEELIPARWRRVHASWGEGYEGADANRGSMRVNHGKPDSLVSVLIFWVMGVLDWTVWVSQSI